MTLKIGSLFSGYGGLDLGIQGVIDSETAWFCEIEPAPSKILAHHWPNTPNLGDITAVDWEVIAKEAPVDILSGGFP
jgi:DNA (cytosine-5)-methyltransferase 1